MQILDWQKRGLLLDPQSPGTPDWRRRQCGMCSVLPQGDGWRVYLTGRDADYRFQIGWLELDRDLRIVHEPAGNPFLAPGAPGGFDSRGLCMPCVVPVEDLLYLYYAGWGPPDGPRFVNRVGLALSRDGGHTWERSAAPLALVDERDPIGVGTVHVIRERPDDWRMWYTSFSEWRDLGQGQFRHYYHIRYAESADGRHWEKPRDNVCIDYEGEEYAIGRPMVLREVYGYRMWFCVRAVGGTYQIGYAESPDGRRWTRHPSGVSVSPTGWDSEMVEYAFVLRRPQDYLMFYNGNGFGTSGTGLAVAPVLTGQ